MKISNMPIESQDTCTHSIEMSIPIEGQFRRRFIEACDFIYNVHSLHEESELSTTKSISPPGKCFLHYSFFLVVEKKSID